MARLPEKNSKYKLEVPLDASGIDGFKPDKKVKVLAVDNNGNTYSELVKLNVKGKGATTLKFKENPGALRIIVGPEDASDEDLQGLQTIQTRVAAKQWRISNHVELGDILISPYYWWWWMRWCRSFTIRGRVLCPDGRPAPGAKVCAYDVDAWWWWSSKQLVSCATTDTNGAFEIKFKWCCGWWPWWWWRLRVWELDPKLMDRIIPVLRRNPELKRIPLPDPAPDFTIFEKILGEDALADINAARLQPPIAATDYPSVDAAAKESSRAAELVSLARSDLAIKPDVLPRLRDRLLEKYPSAPQLGQLKLWPWWPWQPWWDCTPDIIFRVTQDCQQPGSVIYQEDYSDARWNIPTDLNVTLTANENACCLPDVEDDPEGECALITDVCNTPINYIGGNPGAAASPVGYLSPGAISKYADRPFGGRVYIQGQVGSDVDYYEFEWSSDGGVSWHEMPTSAVHDVPRQNWVPSTNTFQWVNFLDTIDGRRVFESRQHYEAHHDPFSWNNTRYWMAHNYMGLMNWYTHTPFINGLYRLRIRGWNLVGGHLTGGAVLPTCSTATPAALVLRIDNRLEGALSGHPPSTPDHPCGSGTVHKCTLEPDTDIVSVKIIHQDNSHTAVTACGNVPVVSTDKLQVDFFAHDPEGHLSYYTLKATYGENQVRNLLAQPGLTLTPLGGAPVPAASQVGPRYSDARLVGATAPEWRGGAIRLEVPVNEAFPVSCCYQLELRAHKRTVVGCNYSLWNHTNYSEYSFMIVI